MTLVRTERVGVFLVGLSRRRVVDPSPGRVAFPMDSSRRRVVHPSPERVTFPRDLSRSKAEIGLLHRKVAPLAAALREVDSAVGI